MAFFLKPSEELVGGTILDVIVLAPDEAILLRCNQVWVPGMMRPHLVASEWR